MPTSLLLRLRARLLRANREVPPEFFSYTSVMRQYCVSNNNNNNNNNNNILVGSSAHLGGFQGGPTVGLIVAVKTY